MMNQLRETIANIQHEIWAHWMKYMFTQGDFTRHMSLNGKPDTTSWIMPGDKIERWQRQIETDYSNLTEKEKESDRHQADKVILALNLEKYVTEDVNGYDIMTHARNCGCYDSFAGSTCDCGFSDLVSFLGVIY